MVSFQFIARVNRVHALADCFCGNWHCPERFEGGIGDNYGAGWQQCYCAEVGIYDESIEPCTSWGCPPGTYVCNRDDQCCDYNTVYSSDDDSSGTNTCGNGVCDAKETCDNCGADCGACCGDGTCNYGETCFTCEADCGICDPGERCGDGVCSGIGEVCDECWVDCGFCPRCGDYSCTGFETCFTCETDCGTCDNSAWWQVWGGHVRTEAGYGYTIRSLIPSLSICTQPSCYPFLSVTDRDRTPKSDGFPFMGGGEILANGQISDRVEPVYATNTLTTRLRENYTYFYKRYSLGFSPEDDFYHTDLDAREPTESKEAYFHAGNLVIQSPWDVTTGESYVIFIDGDLNIEDPLGEGELIKVEEGGFLAFIVTGDINIAESVGNTTLSDTTANIEGVYIANGTINILSNDGLDKRFIGEGTFVGWTSVNMARSFDDGPENELYPTETFIYRPDFVRYVPERMKRPQMLWQETN